MKDDDLGDFEEDLRITIRRPHPYFRELESAAIWQIPRSTWWIVKWRSFDTMGQDAEFPTEAQARAFHRDLIRRQFVTCRLDDYLDADRSWRELYSAKPT
jgi:hypothetical protein